MVLQTCQMQLGHYTRQIVTYQLYHSFFFIFLLHCGIESIFDLPLTLLDRMITVKHFVPVRHVYGFYASRYWYQREQFQLHHRMPNHLCNFFSCENRKMTRYSFSLKQKINNCTARKQISADESHYTIWKYQLIATVLLIIAE